MSLKVAFDKDKPGQAVDNNAECKERSNRKSNRNIRIKGRNGSEWKA